MAVSEHRREALGGLTEETGGRQDVSPLWLAAGSGYTPGAAPAVGMDSCIRGQHGCWGRASVCTKVGRRAVYVGPWRGLTDDDRRTHRRCKFVFVVNCLCLAIQVCQGRYGKFHSSWPSTKGGLCRRQDHDRRGQDGGAGNLFAPAKRQCT
jgi:hypothetical protein